jgi:hypothetical protein
MKSVYHRPTQRPRRTGPGGAASSIAFLLWVMCAPTGSSQSLKPVPGGAPAFTVFSGASSVGFPFDPSRDLTVPSGPPSNLEIPNTLKPMVARMWRKSPTFRRQCARLTEASLTITVWLRLPKEITGVNAVTEIQVRHGAPHSVLTRLRTAEPEYLAHEIEHVLEHIDGVNLRWSVEHGLEGVRLTGSGRFETDRAVGVGQLVADEVRAKGR